MRLLSGIVILLLTVFAIIGIYYTIVLFSKTNKLAEKDTSESSEATVIQCNGNATLNEPCYGLSMIRRYEWLAQPPKKAIDKIQLPVKRIIITDTGSAECLIKPQCLNLVRNIQEEHVRRADDIEYNFLMDTKGGLYEGRGWMLENGQLTDGFRKNSYWIAFIGSLNTIPTDVRTESMNRFVERAISVGNLNVSYEVYCFFGTINSTNIELTALTNVTQCYL